MLRCFERISMRNFQKFKIIGMEILKVAKSVSDELKNYFWQNNKISTHEKNIKDYRFIYSFIL